MAADGDRRKDEAPGEPRGARRAQINIIRAARRAYRRRYCTSRANQPTWLIESRRETPHLPDDDKDDDDDGDDDDDDDDGRCVSQLRGSLAGRIGRAAHRLAD